MKKFVCSVCLVVGLFVGAQAQFDAREVINKGMQLCLGVGLFPGGRYQCNTQQIDRAVEQAAQRGIDKQDCQIHDIYTQSYLQKAPQEQKPLVITRSNKEWREIYLLGDAYHFDKAEALTGEGPTDFMNTYVNSRAEQRIALRKFTEKRTPQDVLADIKGLFRDTGFKLQTYDPTNTLDGMISFVRTHKDGTADYMVFRVFKGPEGKVFMGRVSRRLGSVNIPIMQGIFRALKQTPTQTLTEHFVENECKLGTDCY